MICYKVTVSTGHSAFAPAGGKFELHYEVGAETRAVQGTMGVFCFEEMSQARDFHTKNSLGFGRILKVEGIGRPYRPRKRFLCYRDDLFLDWRRIRRFEKVSEGTVCFRAVRVLEEVGSHE